MGCCRNVKLVVAKCWDSNPRGYFLPPRNDEPVRPIDPSAWVAHTEAVRQQAAGLMPVPGASLGGPMTGGGSVGGPVTGSGYVGPVAVMPATSAFGQSSSSLDSSSSPLSSHNPCE